MAKNIQSAMETQIDASGRRPVLLFELQLSSTIRYCLAKSNITFPSGGNVYTAKHIEVSKVSQNMDGFINRITLKFDNTSRDIGAYVNTESFQDKTLTIKRIFLDDYDASTDYVQFFEGKMEEVETVTNSFVEVSAIQGKSLRKTTSERDYQTLCPHEFGGDKCNFMGNSDLSSLTASGTADSGTTTTLIDDALTQADDFWNFGTIEITKSGTTYNRIVTDFVASTNQVSFDIAVPFSIDTDVTYTIYKGCDKTWETCKAENAYGPGSDNKEQFGGTLHLIRPLVDGGRRSWGRRGSDYIGGSRGGSRSGKDRL